MRIYYRQIKQIGRIFLYPSPVLKFLHRSVGQQYAVGLLRKVRLLLRVVRISSQPGNASTFYEQLTIVHRVLEIPRNLEGVVAEFGCYKALATASLSLACALTKRRLVAFDSFQGLPEPEEVVTNLGTGSVLKYKAGDYSATLEEAENNVRKYGNIGVCEFVKGYFDQTIPRRNPEERYVLIFEDADLPQSVRTVLRWAWPRLQGGCIFFCHEARDFEVVKLFYDDRWWHENLGLPGPGFVGSGSGLPLSPSGSMLGYTVKLAGYCRGKSSS